MTVSSQKPLILVGAGSHARVLIECLSTYSNNILGVVDPKLLAGERALGITVLGTDEIVLQYSPEEILLVNGIGMVEYSDTRRDVSDRMRHAGFRFLVVVHSGAIVTSDVDLKEGAQIMAGAILQPRTTIGRDSIVNTGALVDHDCVIGSGCHICPGVTLAGGVIIGDEVMVGSGSTVLPGRAIGNRTVIGAGSVIDRDVESDIRFIQPRQESAVIRER